MGLITQNAGQEIYSVGAKNIFRPKMFTNRICDHVKIQEKITTIVNIVPQESQNELRVLVPPNSVHGCCLTRITEQTDKC